MAAVGGRGRRVGAAALRVWVGPMGVAAAASDVVAGVVVGRGVARPRRWRLTWRRWRCRWATWLLRRGSRRRGPRRARWGLPPRGGGAGCC